ncbi:LOW QUALITY PROTEIN: hypothetical protein HZS_948, partial [Henneguya salminicola]
HFHQKASSYRSLLALRLCNQSEITENEISRTNNKVEGWYNAFTHLKSSEYLKIFGLLQREPSLVDVKIDTIYMLTTQKNTRPAYNQINTQLI